MRAESGWRRSALLFVLALVGTGCASARPSGVGRTLGSLASTAVAESEEREAASPEPVEGDSAEEQQRPRRRQPLYRRHESREPLLGAGPAVRGLPAVTGQAVVGALPQEDGWERLLTNAGVAPRDERPLAESPLTAAQAERLMRVLLNKPMARGAYPARMAVGHVLRQALTRGELSREELRQWAQRFRLVAVLRPDGYLAWVRTGRTQQKAYGAVQWKEGAFRSGPFELGRFYASNGFMFWLADEQLQPIRDGPVFAEVYDDADYINRSLDGAASAMVAMVMAVGEMLTHPVDSLAALSKLPAGVAELIASSPEYLERFQYMTRGEQIEVVSELVSSLLLTKGTAGGTSRTIAGGMLRAEATVPVLALSADGALVLERVAVPVGQAAQVLAGAPGAALLLHRANTGAGGAGTAGGPGPGEWGPSQEKMEPGPSRDYQEFITGHSADEAYWVGGVGKASGGTKFDGFKQEKLIEAKGPGYANKFEDNFDPKPWFRATGAQELRSSLSKQIGNVGESAVRAFELSGMLRKRRWPRPSRDSLEACHSRKSPLFINRHPRRQPG